MVNEDSILVRRLKDARTSRQMTLEAVATAIDTSVTSIWRYEAGHRRPSGPTLHALANLYGRPVAWFFGDDADAPGESPPSVEADGNLRPQDPPVPAPAEHGIADIAHPESVGNDNEEATPRDTVVRRFDKSIVDLWESMPWDQSEPAFALRAAYPNLSEISRRLIANFIRQVEEQEILEGEKHSDINRTMMVFLGESGVPGHNFSGQSSPYFVMALVIFNEEVAEDCNENIDNLRRRLGVGPGFAFDFFENSDEIRKSFLATIAEIPFQYHAFALDQDLDVLADRQYHDEDDLLAFAVRAIFSLASEDFVRCKVVFDERRRSTFQRQLQEYLHPAGGHDPSSFIADAIASNGYWTNLLQLAGYVAEVSNCSVRNEEPGRTLRDAYLVRQALSLRVWPERQNATV